MDAALTKNELTAQEQHLPEHMNKIGPNAEITIKNAQKVLKLSESTARRSQPSCRKGLSDHRYYPYSSYLSFAAAYYRIKQQPGVSLLAASDPGQYFSTVQRGLIFATYIMRN